MFVPLGHFVLQWTYDNRAVRGIDEKRRLDGSYVSITPFEIVR